MYSSIIHFDFDLLTPIDSIPVEYVALPGSPDAVFDAYTVQRDIILNFINHIPGVTVDNPPFEQYSTGKNLGSHYEYIPVKRTEFDVCCIPDTEDAYDSQQNMVEFVYLDKVYIASEDRSVAVRIANYVYRAFRQSLSHPTAPPRLKGAYSGSRIYKYVLSKTKTWKLEDDVDDDEENFSNVRLFINESRRFGYTSFWYLPDYIVVE